MELKIYLRVLLQKWWIIISAFLITFMFTVYSTFTEIPVYEATATYLVVPSSVEEKTSLSAFGLLTTRSEIASTYAEVASSETIKNIAASKLGLSDEIKKTLVAQSQLLPGTTVLQITAQGSDKQVVRDFTNQVGAETINLIRSRYEAFALEPLDPAKLPKAAIRPNKPLNLALGAIMGSILGIGLAFIATYIQTPTEQISSFGIIDEHTGVYNKRYFMQRLGEEMSRAKRNTYPLSLAVMNVDHLGVINSSSPQIRGEALRRVALLLKQYLREEDLMAHFGKGIFTFLLPDMSGVSAKETMEKLQTRLAWTPLELETSGVKLNLSGSAGIVAYRLDNTGQDELFTRASRALEEAEVAGYGKVVFSEDAVV